MPTVPPRIIERVVQGAIEATPGELSHLSKSPFVSRLAPTARQALSNYEASPQFLIGSMSHNDLINTVPIGPVNQLQMTEGNFRWNFNKLDIKDVPKFTLEPDPDRPWVVKATMEDTNPTFFLSDIRSQTFKSGDRKSPVPILLRYKDPKYVFDANYQTPSYIAIQHGFGDETLVPFPQTSKLKNNGAVPTPAIPNDFSDALIFQKNTPEDSGNIVDALFDPTLQASWRKSRMSDPDSAQIFLEHRSYNEIHNRMVGEVLDAEDVSFAVKQQKDVFRQTLQAYNLVENAFGLRELADVPSIYKLNHLAGDIKMSRAEQQMYGDALDLPMIWFRVDSTSTRDLTGDLAVYSAPAEMGAHFGTVATQKHISNYYKMSRRGAPRAVVEDLFDRFRSHIPDEKKQEAMKYIGEIRLQNQPTIGPDGFVYKKSTTSMENPQSPTNLIADLESRGLMVFPEDGGKAKEALMEDLSKALYDAHNVTQDTAALMVKSPLYLVDNSFHPATVAKQLLEVPKFNKYRAELEDLSSGFSSDTARIQTQKLQKILSDEGYDHIIYFNRAEAPGQPSVIVWDKSKIKFLMRQESLPQNWDNFVLTSLLGTGVGGGMISKLKERTDRDDGT